MTRIAPCAALAALLFAVPALARDLDQNEALRLRQAGLIRHYRTVQHRLRLHTFVLLFHNAKRHPHYETLGFTAAGRASPRTQSDGRAVRRANDRHHPPCSGSRDPTSEPATPPARGMSDTEALLSQLSQGERHALLALVLAIASDPDRITAALSHVLPRWFEIRATL